MSGSSMVTAERATQTLLLGEGLGNPMVRAAAEGPSRECHFQRCLLLHTHTG